MARRIGVAPQDCADPEVTWLTARAVALLVMLRDGAKSVVTIAKSLGESRERVDILASEVAELGVVAIASVSSRSPHTTIVTLTDEGRDWIARSRCAL